MTTTSRRPPATAPAKKKRPDPDRPADADAAAGRAAPPRRPAKGAKGAAAPAKARPRRGAPPEPAAPKRAPAKKASPAKAPPAKAPGGDAPAAAVRARSGSRPARRSAAVPPRAPFVLLVIALLGGALVSLLLLNTVLAKDAFTLSKLEQQNKELDQRGQELQAQNEEENSPQNLARKAEAQGMVQNKYPRFYFPGTGKTNAGGLRPVPQSATASAGAAAVVGVPGTVVPGDGVPAPSGANGSGGSAQGNGSTQGNGAARGNGSGHGNTAARGTGSGRP
ncbi:hypothetical protein [Actinomadura physcomitrii]|uniref:hypothetical protein n=1 Tax=Actinomadura physcomitrii TaxID=2650748 RepID=UPI001922A5C9|nr:hypothetical protein [Actinomadura physcomitrii]